MAVDPANGAVLVTGVSTGIGHDATRYLVEKGFFVFGSVRNPAAAARMEQEFPGNFRVLEFDVTDTAAIAEASQVVEDALGGRGLRALVNNAGLAVPGPMQFLADDKFRQQLEVGLFGVRNVTNAFLPLLGARPAAANSGGNRMAIRPGRIINISSISGILNTPINGAYCVAKHAMESLGEVYRRELFQYGIDVVSIQPGPIRSRIWDKNVGSMNEYAETDYAPMVARANEIMARAQKDALPAETISKLIHKIIEAKRPRCAYVVHKNKWSATLMAKYLPARLVDRMIWRAMSR